MSIYHKIELKQVRPIKIKVFNQYFNCSLHFEKEYFPGFGTFYNITFYNHKGNCHDLEGSSRRSFKRAFKYIMKKLNKNFQEVIFN